MADTKKYYWLKLKEDFFEEKQIKYLRSLPDGDKLVIAYLKMQLKSLKTEGFIKYDSVLPSNIEELAMILDEDTNIIQLMIKALEQTKALEILDDGSFYMIAMQDLIGKEGQSAERVRQFRARKKQELLQCNTDVTECNTEIELEKEKEIEKDNIYEYIESNFARTLSPIEYEEISNWKDDELTRYAIKQAVLNGVYNIKYISKILFNYEKQGIKTVQQAQEKEKKFNNRNKVIEEVPEWFNKELKNDSMSEEDKQDVDNMLEDIESMIGGL
jgi:predicted phage replisome organizer